MPHSAGSAVQSSPSRRTAGCTPPLPYSAAGHTGSGFVQCTGTVWCSRCSKTAVWAERTKVSVRLRQETISCLINLVVKIVMCVYVCICT